MFKNCSNCSNYFLSCVHSVIVKQLENNNVRSYTYSHSINETGWIVFVKIRNEITKRQTIWRSKMRVYTAWKSCERILNRWAFYKPNSFKRKKRKKQGCLSEYILLIKIEEPLTSKLEGQIPKIKSSWKCSICQRYYPSRPTQCSKEFNSFFFICWWFNVQPAILKFTVIRNGITVWLIWN